MNIGIVVLDTLRKDVFDSQLVKTLGNADHVFERFYSTSRWTVPAHASLFTGGYPSEVGTHSYNQHLTTPQLTLPETLREAGFRTLGFSNNTYIDSFFDFDRGFETFVRGPILKGRPECSGGFNWSDLFSDLPDGPSKYPQAVAKVIQSDAPTLQTLQEGVRLAATADSMAKGDKIDWVYNGLADQRFDSDTFLFANLMPCHSPYNPPEEYTSVTPYDVDPFELTLREEPVTEEQHERQWKSYQACAAYLDDALQLLITEIDWDLLVICSDHGELFGEHGLRQHQYGVYEELVHVPAVAYGSRVPTGRTDRLTSILDIYRTVLDMADVDDGKDGHGQNLFKEERDSVYVESLGNYRASPDAQGIDAKIPLSWANPHYAYIEDNRKYISDKDGERVHDLETGEETNEGIERLRKRTDQLREGFDTPEVEDSDRKDEAIPGEIQDRLEHLGYK